MVDSVGIMDITSALTQELHSVALRVARSCAQLLVEQRPADLGVAATKASATDVVTEMDRRSEDLAVELIRQARPHDGFFGEEGTHEAGTSGITWIVDPIDGTVNYLYSLPAYAVSVAAVEGDPQIDGGWRPVAAAVANVALDEVFHAQRGGGSFVVGPQGERQLRFSGARELGQSLLATGFGYEATTRAQQGLLVAELLPKVRDIRRIGSAALDMCWVASGQLDAYYEAGCYPWDFAGGWLIASEAGAVVRSFDGDFPTHKLLCVGRRETVDYLTEFVAARSQTQDQKEAKRN